jgi:hypothetical protein
VAGAGRDLEDFRRFIAQPLFALSVYKAPEGGYCVGLLVKCGDPGGWIAVWRGCYGDLEAAEELLNSIEPLARSRLGDLLLAVEVRGEAVAD